MPGHWKSVAVVIATAAVASVTIAGVPSATAAHPTAAHPTVAMAPCSRPKGAQCGHVDVPLDPADVAIRCRVNGEVRQRASTAAASVA